MVLPISHVITMDLIALETGSELAVPSTTTVYSQSFQWPNGTSFAIEYLFSSDASVDVTLEIESGSVVPTTEGAADTTNYGVGNTIESNIANEFVHRKAPSPTVSGFCRFKLTGNGSNAASTKLTKLKLDYVTS